MWHVIATDSKTKGNLLRIAINTEGKEKELIVVLSMLLVNEERPYGELLKGVFERHDMAEL